MFGASRLPSHNGLSLSENEVPYIPLLDLRDFLERTCFFLEKSLFAKNKIPSKEGLYSKSFPKDGGAPPLFCFKSSPLLNVNTLPLPTPQLLKQSPFLKAFFFPLFHKSLESYFPT